MQLTAMREREEVDSVSRNMMKEWFDDSSTGKKLLDYACKQVEGRKRFQVDDEWIDEPKGRITDVQYRLTPEAVNGVLAAAQVWNMLEGRKQFKSTNPEEIVVKLWEKFVSGDELFLFTPWGPRYGYETRGTEIKENDAETKALEELAEVTKGIRDTGMNVTNLLMYADLYGTDVNGLPVNVVRAYGQSLKQTAVDRLQDPLVKPWSVIRSGAQDMYDALCAQVSEMFGTYVSEGTFEKMVKVGERFNPGSGRESSRKYCIERVVEARMIDLLYDPIKASMVIPEKDELDGSLKRVYVINNRAPWLGR
ncbi:hypothetical protein HN419_04085 [Candidatus Woesearchaeota archaeon]|jgi:hypothetical protein|nr:hypothetical protein [Candidatus Woesearchaeota archaeon]MBT3537942.1 hypothetical protein [Candidatus Woesearchaeota archaeon]MBT4698080.1 hypothetical protein [Candidatus Woesearchaeota archaeon]MBT4717188.1 hypothetical protein [Candidatus Woesearchaeota archaeon]MBT7105611.1 hypothetical protein [Candidatus Woesearchaeota archaeon]